MGKKYHEGGMLARDLGNGHSALESAQPRVNLQSAGFNMTIMPNLSLLFSLVRVYIPIAVDRTEIRYYPAKLKGAPEEVDQKRLRDQMDFFGPSGFGGPDDVEMFVRAQLGLQAKSERWVLLARGYGRDVTDEAGLRTGDHQQSETGIRAIYRAWRKLMAEG